VILLDTNYLIRMLVKGTPVAAHVSRWILEGESFCTSAICWYEFVTGPVDEQGTGVVMEVLDERIVPFTADYAREAARLYNATERRRRTRIDAMIAATAIVTNAHLATENRDDFTPFEPLGLRIAG
jgi:predicted nucleic acid-binding protein